MLESRVWRRRLGAVGLLVVFAVLAAACGDDDDDDAAGKSDSATTATSAADSGDGGDDIVADAKARLEEWYEGTERPMPDEGPAPKKGANVWVISCGQGAEGCAVPGNAAKEAGEEIGWDVTIFDGKLNPGEFNTGVSQAVAAGADAIILNVVDCFLVKGALEEAKKAGVVIFGLHSLDCDDPTVGGEALFDGEVDYGDDFENYAALVEAFGSSKADWIIAKTEGKAKTIEFRQNELLVVKYINDGFDKRFKECTTCELVETVNFVLADLGPPVQQKAQGAILKHPEANSIMVPYDSAMTFGIDAAIVESGRADELLVMGGEGFPSNVKSVLTGGGQDAGTGYGFEWEGWAAIDGVNRLLNGEETVDCGCGFRVWDIDHNISDEEGARYEPETDFRTQYRKIWGIS